MAEQRGNDRSRVERAQVAGCLADAHEHDGLPRRVHHGHGGADLVVDRVKRGEHDAVDEARVRPAGSRAARGCTYSAGRRRHCPPAPRLLTAAGSGGSPAPAWPARASAARCPACARTCPPAPLRSAARARAARRRPPPPPRSCRNPSRTAARGRPGIARACAAAPPRRRGTCVARNACERLAWQTDHETLHVEVLEYVCRSVTQFRKT
ncbi:hypothetical protein FGB62_206g07 [Gracilaria domingensis]|nr:hypothetical protein FGB62_206g07 [Gracilaria domingensis]